MQEEGREGTVADTHESTERSETTGSEQQAPSPCSSSKDRDMVSILSVIGADLVEIFGQHRIQPKVLKLFDVKTFREIENHQQLERKLSTLGFVIPHTGRPCKADDDSRWKEYTYGAEAAVLLRNGHFDGGTTMVKALRPRLPYPNITMHHPDVYKAFLFLVGTYIGHEKVQEHFQVRCLPAPAFWFKMMELEFRVRCQERLNTLSDWFLAYRKGYVDDCTKRIISDISIFEDAYGEIDTSGSVLKRLGRRS